MKCESNVKEERIPRHIKNKLCYSNKYEFFNKYPKTCKKTLVLCFLNILMNLFNQYSVSEII